MVESTSYLFAISMGVVVVILTYLQGRQRQEKIPRSTYIKHFMIGTSISLATACFGCGPGLGGSNQFNPTGYTKTFQPEIMTGTPDF